MSAPTRKLAAILAADVAGYSKLMGEDETGTLAALRELRNDLFQPTVSDHRGEVVKSMGDGWLVEFASVVDAVNCALHVQENLVGHEIIKLRIGIHIGDIVHEDEDIYGDGVNIAARLQEISVPGGVALSGRARDFLDSKLANSFCDAGEKQLKNIAEAVRVYVSVGGAGTAAGTEALPLPDKPSIAVLPFENMSGDPEQEYFADGMTEDIITGLSRFRSLFVIARNSTFAYKGKSPEVRDAARELGVRYILEGSVRRAGQRIRITAQLIDAEGGNHHWAERYDRELEDIFDVQDEVTEEIIAAIAPEIDQVERNRAQRKPPGSLDAWGLYQRGLTAYHATTKEGLENAVKQFDQVNDLDPGFAPAFAMGADARTRLTIHYLPGDTSLLHQAQDKAGLGMTLDARDPDCLWADGKVLSYLGHHAAAVSRGEDAVALNPTSAMAHQAHGLILGRAGRPEEALIHINQAIRLSPRDLFLPGFLGFGSIMLFDLGRYQDSLDWASRASRSPNPRPNSFVIEAAVLSKLGRHAEAADAVAGLLAQTTVISVRVLRNWLTWNKLLSPESNEQLIDALRDAGLPEE